jgi:hypothetical protein
MLIQNNNSQISINNNSNNNIDNGLIIDTSQIQLKEGMNKRRKLLLNQN